MQASDRKHLSGLECACPVCGSAEVHTDEVADRALLLLGWCARCDHRFTRPASLPALSLRSVPFDRLEASAA